MRSVLAPGTPRRQKVIAQAEAGFQDGERGAPAPAFMQAAAGNEDMARLCQGTDARVVEVAEGGRKRRAVGVEVDHGGCDGVRLHGAFIA